MESRIAEKSRRSGFFYKLVPGSECEMLDRNQQTANSMKFLTQQALVLAMMATFSQAADFRIWTSSKGTSIEAQLLKYRDGVVKLVTKDPKEISLKVTDLSLADRQYLIEYAEAAGDVIFQGTPSIPELSYRKPKDFLTKLQDRLTFDGNSVLSFDLYETKHFVFAVGKGVRVTGIAETAEACWHGMAFQHFEFRENWGETRQLIVIPSESEQYAELGKYQVALLEKTGQEKYAAKVKLTWDKVAATGVTVPAESVEKLKLKEQAAVFNIKDPKRFRRKFDSFQTHVICGRLFGTQVGGVSSVSGVGYFSLSTGHAYYKEIQLTQKTETNLISADYGGDVATKSGFEDGSAWPRLLKKLVKKGKVKPGLLKTLAIQSPAAVTPENLVTMYSLSCYMQSTQKRIAAYAKLARLINTSDQIPDPTELVKIFGFDSIGDFEKDWIAFVVSKDFK